MTYVVLARKWRPQSFEELTGQGHVARTLQNAIEAGRIPHAILLTGPRGVGKTSSARIISMALNCEHGPTPTPCGVCQACVEVKSGRSVDILEIDGASNRGINEIRELRDSVQYAPSRDRYKVYIIDEVHMLTTEAFNALLKTLEEPPPHVVFIFATTEPQKIPVTILSRCQRFDFRQINLPDLIQRLDHILKAEGIAAEPEALHMIARQAAGGMRDALSLLDQVISSSDGNITVERTADLLGAADRRQLFLLSDAVIRRDSAAALTTLQHVLARGTDVSWFASEFAAHLRDLTVLAVAGSNTELAIMTEDELASAQAQIQQTDSTTLEALLDIMIQSAEDISRSSMGELRFELALIRMCEIATRQSLDYLIALLERSAGIDRPLPTPPTTLAPSARTALANEAGTAPTTGKPQTSTSAVAPSAPAAPAELTPTSSPVAARTSEAATTPAELTPASSPVAARASEAVSTPAAPSAATATKQSAAAPVTPTNAPLAPAEPEPPVVAPAATATPVASPVAATISDVQATPPPAELAKADEPAPPPTAAATEAAREADGVTHSAPNVATTPATAAPSTPLQADASASPASAFTEPTFRTWRQAVNELGEGFDMARRMLAMGHCLPEDGVFRVGISSAYLQDREVLQKEFGGICERYFGRPWTLELVEDTSLSADQHARAWRIRNEEKEEEEALKRQIHQRLEEDPLIQMVKRRWPDYVLQREHIHFRLETTSNLSAGEGEP